VGLEPVRAMLAHCRVVAPGSAFVVGRAEQLPFAPGVFDIIAAAGSLNYVDLDRFLPEAARVLAPAGVIVVYDFSAARRIRDDARLGAWFNAFERRYRFPPGYEMDIRTANLGAAGLGVEAFVPLEITLPMTLASYLDYAMSETNVEEAVARGTAERDIRDWCAAGLREIFGGGAREILFDAYAAIISRGGSRSPTAW